MNGLRQLESAFENGSENNKPHRQKSRTEWKKLVLRCKIYIEHISLNVGYDIVLKLDPFRCRPQQLGQNINFKFYLHRIAQVKVIPNMAALVPSDAIV